MNLQFELLFGNDQSQLIQFNNKKSIKYNNYIIIANNLMKTLID